MIRKNQKLINRVNEVTDAILIFLSYFLAYFIRFDLMRGYISMPMLGSRTLIMVGCCSCLLVLAYYILRMYGSNRFKKPSGEIFTIFALNGVGTTCLLAAFYIIRITDFSRITVLFFWLISSFAVVAKRVIGRAVLRYFRKLGYNQKHVIVVGNGRLAHQYVEDIRANPSLGYTVDGYVSKSVRAELGKCLGSYEDLVWLLEAQDIDEMVVALEAHEMCFMKSVLEAADKEGIRVSIIPFYNDYIPAHPTINSVGRIKLVDIRSTPLDNLGSAMVKRGMDIVGSLLLIVLTSPVMLAVAIGVKVSSPGPILFKQERIGLNKKPFEMWKFRSMRMNSTEDTAWSTREDPRKTRFGSLIRKFSLDELPQFFNVLAGQMSLVGPRPEIPFHVQHFKEEVPLYLVRQQVRPGITGWAQVNGLRGDTSIEERVKYDIWYIENWSLGLDIRILARTVLGGMVNNESLEEEKV